VISNGRHEVHAHTLTSVCKIRITREHVEFDHDEYVRSEFVRGDWKRETWHRETIEIVEANIARLDNSAPYRKSGHRETSFIVYVEAQHKLIFAAGSIIWAAHRLYVCSFT